METSFSGGRSRREPPTMDKQLVNFITCGCESNAPLDFVMLRPCGFSALIEFSIIWLSYVLIMRVPDEDYSKYTAYELNL
jgi:hypothetical protein